MNGISVYNMQYGEKTACFMAGYRHLYYCYGNNIDIKVLSRA